MYLIDTYARPGWWSHNPAPAPQPTYDVWTERALSYPHFGVPLSPTPEPNLLPFTPYYYSMAALRMPLPAVCFVRIWDDDCLRCGREYDVCACHARGED